MYYVKSFDGLNLQTEKDYGMSDDIGSGLAINRYIQTPNGWYDINQSQTAKRNVNHISATRLFHYSSAAAMRGAVEDWRAKLGTRGILTVEWWDGTARWTYARLDNVQAPSFIGDIASAQVSLQWSMIEQNWRASSLTSDTEDVGGSSSTNWTVNNPGDLTVYDMTITIASAGYMNNPTLTNQTTGHFFQYDLAPFTQTLIVDTGAKTQNRTYNFFNFSNKNEWFVLQPGNNSIRIAMDSGSANVGASVKFEFYARYG